MHTASKGFTLIELLLVVGIIGILSSIVIVAINPNRQLEQSRNAKRDAYVLAIRNATNQFYLDNQTYPGDKTWPTTEGTAIDICAPGITHATCMNLENDLVPTYIAAIPTDSTETNANFSGFAGYRTSNGNAFLLSGVRFVFLSRHYVSLGYGG